MAKKGSIEESVLTILEKVGAEVIAIVRKNHVKIKYKYRGQKRMIVMPQTASDKRAMKNAVAFCRRQLKEIYSGRKG